MFYGYYHELSLDGIYHNDGVGHSLVSFVYDLKPIMTKNYMMGVPIVAGYAQPSRECDIA